MPPDEYVRLLERVAEASAHRVAVWSHLSRFTPKQHQEAQRHLRDALRALEEYRCSDTNGSSSTSP
jgi:hypothetical protein